ncbi:MAG: NYs-1 [Parachlamydiales bacterium]|nr:NYs-1 [Parachlamydiales bacterium]
MTISINSLEEIYQHVSQDSALYRQLVPAAKRMAQKCASAAEIGVLHMHSSFGILFGLSKSSQKPRSYLGIDISPPPEQCLNAAKIWAQEAEIDFNFIQANDLDITLDPVDFLLIDSYHTYRHLTYELETFAPSVRSYILLHDTGYPWGTIDENESNPNMENESRYPDHINRTKRGVWPAVIDYLDQHPEWKIYERDFSNAGITIIQRLNS